MLLGFFNLARSAERAWELRWDRCQGRPFRLEAAAAAAAAAS